MFGPCVRGLDRRRGQWTNGRHPGVPCETGVGKILDGEGVSEDSGGEGNTHSGRDGDSRDPRGHAEEGLHGICWGTDHLSRHKRVCGVFRTRKRALGRDRRTVLLEPRDTRLLRPRAGPSPRPKVLSDWYGRPLVPRVASQSETLRYRVR